MAIQWTRTDAEKLIAIFQLHECLWDIKHPKYHERVERETAFNIMLKMLKDDIVGLTLEELKRKIQSIRSQFAKELRQIKASKQKGLDDIRTPKLWCFDLLDFLRPSIENRECKSSLCKPGRIDDISAGEATDGSETISSTSKQIKKRKLDIGGSSNGISEKPEKKSERRFEWLGEQVVFFLNNMVDEDIILEAISKIQENIMMFTKKDRLATAKKKESPVV